MEVDDLGRLEAVVGFVKSKLTPGSIVQVVPARSGASGHMGMVIVTSGLKDFDDFRDAVKAQAGVHFLIKE